MSFLISIFKALISLCNPPAENPQEGQQQQQQQQPQQPHVQHQQAPHEPIYPPHKSQQQQQPSPHNGQAHSSTPPRQQHGDPNQINQHNEKYVSLRARANEEGDLMAKSFEQSHEAYSRGDGALAKELSNQGKDHQKKMEALNKEASDWIFIENNKDSKPGEIDLHGLYVKEAISRTDLALQQAKQRGDSDVHLIVGKGLHSQGGAAKIRPAIEELMQKHQLVAELDPSNAGVLIVHINGSGGGEGAVDPEEISRRLSRGDEGCTIM